MEPKMKELLLLAKSQGVDAPDEGVSLELYPLAEVQDRFLEFLISHRIRPLLILHLLHEIGLEEEYRVGYEKLEYWEYDYDVEDEVKIAEYSPALADETLTGGKLFESLIARLGIESLIARNFVDDGLRYVTNDGPLPPAHKLGSTGEASDFGEREVFLGRGLLITEASILVTDRELAERLRVRITHHQRAFRKFLDEYGDANVPHRVYVTWLLEWFPGLVHVRSIPHWSESEDTE